MHGPCQRWSAILELLRADCPADAQLEEIDRHLDQCPRCRALLENQGIGSPLPDPGPHLAGLLASDPNQAAFCPNSSAIRTPGKNKRCFPTLQILGERIVPARIASFDIFELPVTSARLGTLFGSIDVRHFVNNGRVRAPGNQRRTDRESIGVLDHVFEEIGRWE